MKLCIVYNFAQHYRAGIFKLIDKEYQCDFVFGKNKTDIKSMDYSFLNGNVSETVSKRIGPFTYMKGVPSLAFRDYDNYLVLLGPLSISSWLLLLLLRLQHRKKIYGWTHGWYGKESFLEKVIKKINFKLADGVFVYGDYAKELMIKEGFKAEKVHVIKNSLDYDRQLELRDSGLKSNIYQNHFKNIDPVLIFIGRLTKVKRLDMLIDAVGELKRKGKMFNLVIIGDGKERGYLEECVSKNGISEQTWFYGACYDERTNAELIFNADLCVAPGNVGLTAMHTMVFGTPVISHNNFPYQMPEFEAIIPNETGNYFSYENRQSLIDTIVNWFNENTDRDRVRQACYNEIDKKWTPNHQISILKSVIENE